MIGNICLWVDEYVSWLKIKLFAKYCIKQTAKEYHIKHNANEYHIKNNAKTKQNIC